MVATETPVKTMERAPRQQGARAPAASPSPPSWTRTRRCRSRAGNPRRQQHGEIGRGGCDHARDHQQRGQRPHHEAPVEIPRQDRHQDAGDRAGHRGFAVTAWPAAPAVTPRSAAIGPSAGSRAGTPPSPARTPPSPGTAPPPRRGVSVAGAPVAGVDGKRNLGIEGRRVEFGLERRYRASVPPGKFISVKHMRLTTRTFHARKAVYV